MVLITLGAFVGLFSGLLGVGGGIMLVPILVALGASPINAVATSAMAVFLTAFSGVFYNYRQGAAFALKDLGFMIVPCLIVTQLGVIAATRIKAALLLFLFGLLLLFALILIAIPIPKLRKTARPRLRSLILVGTVAGFLSGMFGVGGGVILVPLQVIVLAFDLKTAARNSLAVVLFAAGFSALGHAFAGNVILANALLIGLGGIVGAQYGAYLAPKLSAILIARVFMTMLFFLAIYAFWQTYCLNRSI